MSRASGECLLRVEKQEPMGAPLPYLVVAVSLLTFLYFALFPSREGPRVGD